MGRARNRAWSWARSDLIGVPVTLLAAGIVLLSILAIYLGPIRGLIFSAPVLIWGLYLTFKRNPEAPDLSDIHRVPEGSRHRVLVIANRGLENPALYDEVSRRAQRAAATELMIIAPVHASSRLRTLADDFDAESRQARERVERALRHLGDRGVHATGHVDEDAEPMSALLDGLREFPADEVMMLPGAESGWEEAETLAERVRQEVGVPVIEADAEDR